MAVKYTRNTTDKVAIKGVLDEEAKTVTYETKDEDVRTVVLQDYLDQFASQPVEIVIQTKFDEDLRLPEEGGDE